MKEVLIVVKPRASCVCCFSSSSLTACSEAAGVFTVRRIGRVTDQYGEPVPDVKVAADGELRDERKQPDDYYELTPLKGITTVTARKAGCLTAQKVKRAAGGQLFGSHSSIG